MIVDCHTSAVMLWRHFAAARPSRSLSACGVEGKQLPLVADEGVGRGFGLSLPVLDFPSRGIYITVRWQEVEMPQLKKVQHTQTPKADITGEVVMAKNSEWGKESYLTFCGAKSYLTFLGLKARNPITLQKEIERGFSFAVLQRLQHRYVFSFEELADALHVSPRTLERRKEGGRLDALESDRALRLSRVYSKAVELYEGNEEAALAWLKRRNKALGGAPPVDLIKTEAGALQVEHLIGRLEHGVYS